MPRFAAHLTMLYQEHSFLDRFAAAARDGFTAVDYMFPYDYPADTIAGLLKEHGLIQVNFNTPPGDWNGGERGLACLPGRESEFRDSFHKALEYAHILEVPRVCAMAGNALAGVEPALQRETFIANLQWAADMAAAAGMDVLIEPISLRRFPGFFLYRRKQHTNSLPRRAAPTSKVAVRSIDCQSRGDVEMKLRQVYRWSRRAAGEVRRYSFPRAPTVTSRISAKATTNTSSASSTSLATKTGSAANTCLWPAQPKASAGCANGKPRMQAGNAGATLAPCSPRRTLSAYAAISSVFRIRAYAGNVRN